MNEHPILFSGPMVRAILDGRKTQTRRVVTPQPPPNCAYACRAVNGWAWTDGGTVDYDYFPKDRETINCPYGAPGDRLWVKETFWHLNQPGQELIGFSDGTVKLRAGRTILSTPPGSSHSGYGEAWKHKPSIFMPRWASRMTIEITDIRVQRVQEISCQDVMAEGSEIPMRQYSSAMGLRCDSARNWYRELWDKINSKRGFGWDVNPWIWALTFRRVGAR